MGLRGRWLYLFLGIVVALVYARGLAGRRVTPHPSVSRPTIQPTASSNAWELKLDQRTLAEAIQRKPGLIRWLGLWTVLILGLGLCGIVILFNTVRQGGLGRLLRYESQLPYAWPKTDFVRMVALVLGVIGLLPFARLALTVWIFPHRIDEHVWSVLSVLMLDGLVVLMVWGFATTQARSFSRTFGVSVRRAPQAIAQGFLAYAAMFPWLFALLGLIATIAERLGIQPPTELIHELLFAEPRRVVVGMTIVLACIVGPIAEEVLFRGVLFATLRVSTSRFIAVLVSSAVFAAVHTNLIGFLPILLLGCLLATLYERSGSLLSPIAVHMFHNALLVGVGLTFKELF
ncbi:MAG: CPBP family intramembrane metalloprotease [Candidatus Omnitrophica bacterium]|nr:CPBP family intramembrane metalloprotease [Candidatus Omnitrophota bacterium]